MQAARIADERPRVGSAAEAQALIDKVAATLNALSHLVGEETELVRTGKVAQALEKEPRKAELAGLYMRGVEQVKLNAVALARFAPAGLGKLRGAHEAFQELIETNQIVLATARAVSEQIIRELAQVKAPPARPSGYGPAVTVGAGLFHRPSADPLILSRRL